MGDSDLILDEGLDSEAGPGERHSNGKFAQGNKAAAGRKGARNRLSTALLESMAKDFEENGEAAIVRVRQDRPSEYLKVMASLVPKNVELDMDNPLARLSPGEIDDLMKLMAEMRALEGVAQN
jgi:hypothetical protein